MSGQLVGDLILGLITAIIAIAIIYWVMRLLYHRSTKEVSFVRTGFLGEKVVINGGAFVWPVVHDTTSVNMNVLTIEVTREKDDALITKDRMRVDVDAEFFVRVAPTIDAVSNAASTLGHRTLEPQLLHELLVGKFVSALRAVASEMTLQEMHEQRGDYVSLVGESAKEMLAKNGLELESVAITDIDQTDMEYFNPSNQFDAHGLTQLIQDIESKRKLRNDIEQDSVIQIRTRNLEAEKQALDIERESEAARLKQELEIETRRAAQRADLARERAERETEAEQAQITSREAVERSRIANEHAITESRIASEREIRQQEIERQHAIEAAEISSQEEISKARISQEREINEARIANEQKTQAKEIERERSIEQAQITAREATERARIEQERLISEVRIESEEETQRRDIERKLAIETADIAAQEATETAKINQERAIEEARIAKEEETQSHEIASRLSTDSAEINAREKVEKLRIEQELNVNTDQIASDQKLRNLEIKRTRELEEAEIKAFEAVELSNVERDKTLDSARLERQQKLEQLEVVRMQALREAEIAYREEVERAEITVEKGLDEERIAREKSRRKLDVDREKEVEMAEIEKAISVYKKSIEQSAAHAAAEAARANAVEAEEQVQTVRDNEATRRRHNVEILLAEKEVEEAKIAASALKVRSAVEAEAQRMLNEAENVLTDEARISLFRRKLLEHVEGIVRESVKPMEKIEGINILQVDGIGNKGDDGGSRNTTDEIINSALRYRVQAPLVDNILSEIGVEGGNLSKMGGLIREARDLESIRKDVDREKSTTDDASTAGSEAGSKKSTSKTKK